MVKEFVMNHMFMSSILLVGMLSLLLQAMVALSVRGYVKASANVKTTRKKLMINLKNQFETIYGMNYQVRNIDAYVDKYLLKMRILGLSLAIWERLPFLTAGIVTILAGGEAFYCYLTKEAVSTQIEILFSYGLILVCLFSFFHIFGIKSKKQQIHIQLVDYLENYLTNRLIRTQEGQKEMQSFKADKEEEVEPEVAVSKEAESEESEMELLEEFVQRYLA